MSKAVILQHVAHEGPGRLIPILRDFGIVTETRRLYAGDEVPKNLDEVKLLVSLGGPMGVADLNNNSFPFLTDEVRAITQFVQQDRPFLGICLGAQLLAHAAGARVYAMDKPEMGWGPVTFPFPGGTEPIVMGMHDGSPMFHWHNDTFDLPKLPPPANPAPPPAPPPPTGNALLSSTRACKNQAFRFKTHLFGFQYHFEMTPEGIDEMLSKSAADMSKAGISAEQVRGDTKKFYQMHERLGNLIITNLVQYLRAYV